MTPTSSPITASCSLLTTTSLAAATCKYRCVSATSLPSPRSTTRPSPAFAAAGQRANFEERATPRSQGFSRVGFVASRIIVRRGGSGGERGGGLYGYPSPGWGALSGGQVCPACPCTSYPFSCGLTY